MSMLMNLDGEREMMTHGKIYMIIFSRSHNFALPVWFPLHSMQWDFWQIIFRLSPAARRVCCWARVMLKDFVESGKDFSICVRASASTHGSLDGENLSSHFIVLLLFFFGGWKGMTCWWLSWLNSELVVSSREGKKNGKSFPELARSVYTKYQPVSYKQKSKLLSFLAELGGIWWSQEFFSPVVVNSNVVRFTEGCATSSTIKDS